MIPSAQSEQNKNNIDVNHEPGVKPKTSAELIAGFRNVGNVGGEMINRMITKAERELIEREKKGK